MTELEVQLLKLFKRYAEDSISRDNRLAEQLGEFSNQLENFGNICQSLREELKK